MTMRTVAYAVVHLDPPEVWLAEDIDVLHRVLALEVVAATEPRLLGESVEPIRQALLDERWGDAAVEWIRATDIAIDVYTTRSVYLDSDVPADLIGAQLQFKQLFRSASS